MALTLTSLDAAAYGSDGGDRAVLTGTFDRAKRYTVLVGGVEALSGVPGRPHSFQSLDGVTLEFYLPKLSPGTYAVSVSDGTTTVQLTGLIVLWSPYASTPFALAAQFPKNLAVGPRSLEGLPVKPGIPQLQGFTVAASGDGVDFDWTPPTGLSPVSGNYAYYVLTEWATDPAGPWYPEYRYRVGTTNPPQHGTFTELGLHYFRGCVSLRKVSPDQEIARGSHSEVVSCVITPTIPAAPELVIDYDYTDGLFTVYALGLPEEERLGYNNMEVWGWDGDDTSGDPVYQGLWSIPPGNPGWMGFPIPWDTSFSPPKVVGDRYPRVAARYRNLGTGDASAWSNLVVPVPVIRVNGVQNAVPDSERFEVDWTLSSLSAESRRWNDPLLRGGPVLCFIDPSGGGHADVTFNLPNIGGPITGQFVLSAWVAYDTEAEVDGFPGVLITGFEGSFEVWTTAENVDYYEEGLAYKTGGDLVRISVPFTALSEELITVSIFPGGVGRPGGMGPNPGHLVIWGLQVDYSEFGPLAYQTKPINYPTGCFGEMDAGEAFLQWSLPAGYNSAAWDHLRVEVWQDGFFFQDGKDGVSFYNVAPDANGYHVAGLAPGIYRFRIRAEDADAVRVTAWSEQSDPVVVP